MAQLLVRDLDDGVMLRLKERAKLNRRSLQSEAKAILEAAARRYTVTRRSMSSASGRSGFAVSLCPTVPS
jgi:plasmid stability protein